MNRSRHLSARILLLTDTLSRQAQLFTLSKIYQGKASNMKTVGGMYISRTEELQIAWGLPRFSSGVRLRSHPLQDLLNTLLAIPPLSILIRLPHQLWDPNLGQREPPLLCKRALRGLQLTFQFPQIVCRPRGEQNRGLCSLSLTPVLHTFLT